jgi:hypothetical protein
MTSVLINPQDLRDAQVTLFRELLSHRVDVSYVTASDNDGRPCLAVGITGGMAHIPRSWRGIDVAVTEADRAVLAIGERTVPN